MNEPVTITLSGEEALILFEFFARFQDENDFQLRHNAEFVAFSRLSAQLDHALVAPFRPDYQELLAHAREQVAGDYEGLAPGVHP
jgi:hypothetical protein